MERDSQQKAHEMSTFFEKRGYFRTPLEDDLQQASRVCRRDAIQDANVVTNGTEDSLDVYVPSFQQSHQRFLLNYETTKEIFPLPPLTSYRRDQNI